MTDTRTLKCIVCALPADVREAIKTMSQEEAHLYAVGKGFKVSAPAIGKHRRIHNDPRTKAVGRKAAKVAAKTVSKAAAVHERQEARSIELGINDGEIYTGALTHPIGSHEDVLRLMDLDPDKWFIVGDTVRMSSWDGWTKDEDGVSVPARLHSFRARITTSLAPVLTDEDFLRIASTIKVIHSRPEATLTGSTALINLADPQLGKSEGGGVEATIERVMTSLGAAVQWIKDCRKLGHVINEICLAQMGDIFEGCSGNYASQTFTVELNQRQQINLAIRLLSTFIKTLAPLAPKLTVVTVLDNHTQWTRNGSQKPITGDSDSGGAFISDQLEVLFSQTPGYEHVGFITPHDEPVVTANLSGVEVAFAHGHTASGNLETWIDAQTRGLIYRRSIQPRLWITAHSHHFRGVDMGPYFWYQCPSQDGGSKWFYDIKGKWSTPGMLCMLVGEHDMRGHSNVVLV